MRELGGADEHQVDNPVDDAVVDPGSGDNAIDVVRNLDGSGGPHNICPARRDDASPGGGNYRTAVGSADRGTDGLGTDGLGMPEWDLCELEWQHRVQPLRKPDRRPRRGDNPVQRRHLQHEPAPVRHLLGTRRRATMAVACVVVGRD